MHKIPDSANLLLHLDASSSIRVLARLDDPDVLAILVPLAVEALLLVVFLKSVVFSIVLSILDVESQWQCVEDLILAVAAVRVEVSHVEEEGLLVVQVLIEFETIVYFLKLPLASLELTLQVYVGHREYFRHRTLLNFALLRGIPLLPEIFC